MLGTARDTGIIFTENHDSIQYENVDFSHRSVLPCQLFSHIYAPLLIASQLTLSGIFCAAAVSKLALMNYQKGGGWVSGEK